MTMLLSAWQDALRRNMAYKQGREAKADRKRSLMETAGDKIGELASKMFSTNDAMEKLREQHNMAMARDAAQREWEAAQEAEKRSHEHRMTDLKHKFSMEQLGEKPHPQWQTPDDKYKLAMDRETLKLQGGEKLQGSKLAAQDKKTSADNAARERVARILAAARLGVADRMSARMTHGQSEKDAALAVLKETDAAIKNAESSYNASRRAAQSEPSPSRRQSLIEEVEMRFGPTLQKFHEDRTNIVTRYPHLVGKADVPGARSSSMTQSVTTQQPSQPMQSAPQANPFSGLLE